MPRLRVPKTSDAANAASKLPRPLQWPAGAVGGFLESVTGADDPAGSVMGSALPTPLTTQFIRGGVPDRVARELATGDTLERLMAIAPHWAKDKIAAFVAKYPRVAAHMDVRSTPGMGPLGRIDIAPTAKIPIKGMDKGYGRLYTEFDPSHLEHTLFSEQFPATVAHEATHAAQALGNKDAMNLYKLVQDMLGEAPELNPFERSAMAAEYRNMGTPVPRESVNTGLREIVETFPDRFHSRKINDILQRRRGK